MRNYTISLRAHEFSEPFFSCTNLSGNCPNITTQHITTKLNARQYNTTHYIKCAFCTFVYIVYIQFWTLLLPEIVFHSLLWFTGICGELSCTKMHHIFYKLQCYDDFLNHNLLKSVILILIKYTDNTIESLSLSYFCIRFRYSVALRILSTFSPSFISLSLSPSYLCLSLLHNVRNEQ